MGRFTLPAAVAEAMCEPETRARTTEGVARVEAQGVLAETGCEQHR